MRTKTLMRARLLAASMLAASPGAVAAQGAEVPFAGFEEHDASLPVEITSDALELDQAAGTAVFTGAVKAGQGALRLAADRIEVSYVDPEGPGAGEVQRMVATGNVTLTNGAEAAEAERATYEVAAGVIEMEGDVLLTQGGNTLASRTLRIDLNAGTGQLGGRVQTIFVPDAEP